MNKMNYLRKSPYQNNQHNQCNIIVCRHSNRILNFTQLSLKHNQILKCNFEKQAIDKDLLSQKNNNNKRIMNQKKKRNLIKIFQIFVLSNKNCQLYQINNLKNTRLDCKLRCPKKQQQKKKLQKKIHQNKNIIRYGKIKNRSNCVH